MREPLAPTTRWQADDGNGVAVAGPAYGAGGLWFAEGRGQLTVGAHLAVGNLVHLGPDRFLEGGAFGGQRQVELPPCPGKVFVELLFGFLQQGRLADLAGQRLQVRHAVRTQLYPAQGVVLFLQRRVPSMLLMYQTFKKPTLPFWSECAILMVS